MNIKFYTFTLQPKATLPTEDELRDLMAYLEGQDFSEIHYSYDNAQQTCVLHAVPPKKYKGESLLFPELRQKTQILVDLTKEYVRGGAPAFSLVERRVTQAEFDAIKAQTTPHSLCLADALWAYIGVTKATITTLLEKIEKESKKKSPAKGNTTEILSELIASNREKLEHIIVGLEKLFKWLGPKLSCDELDSWTYDDFVRVVHNEIHQRLILELTKKLDHETLSRTLKYGQWFELFSSDPDNEAYQKKFEATFREEFIAPRYAKCDVSTEFRACEPPAEDQLESLSLVFEINFSESLSEPAKQDLLKRMTRLEAQKTLCIPYADPTLTKIEAIVPPGSKVMTGVSLTYVCQGDLTKAMNQLVGDNKNTFRLLDPMLFWFAGLQSTQFEAKRATYVLPERLIATAQGIHSGVSLEEDDKLLNAELKKRSFFSDNTLVLKDERDRLSSPVSIVTKFWRERLQPSPSDSPVSSEPAVQSNVTVVTPVGGNPQ